MHTNDTTYIDEYYDEEHSYVFEQKKLDDKAINSFKNTDVKKYKVSKPIEAPKWRKPSQDEMAEYFRDKDFQYDDPPIRASSLWQKFWDFIWDYVKKLLGFNDFFIPRYVSKAIQYTLIALVVFAIFFVLFKMRLHGFFNTSNEEYAIEDLETVENISTLNLNSMLQKALLNNDFRSAIRVLFFKTLQTLNEKQIITYNKFKTNYEYSYEISHRSSREKFNQLARIYEYVWFGEMQLTATQFAEFKNEFETYNPVQEQVVPHA